MSDENTALAITEDHQLSPASHLKDRQRAAVSMLVAGCTQREVATQLGVARETVTRWVNRNPFFRAELSQQRYDVWEYSQNRLRNLRLKALEVLDMALTKGDVRVALALLKQSEKEAPPAPPETTDQAIDSMVDRDLQNLVEVTTKSPAHKQFRKLMCEMWMPETEEANGTTAEADV